MVSVICKHCGAPVEFEQAKGYGRCKFCGSVARQQMAGETAEESEALLTRAYIFLEDADFERAREYFDKVLDKKPKDYRAYTGLLLADYAATTIGALFHSGKQFAQNANYQKLIKYAPADIRQKFARHLAQLPEQPSVSAENTSVPQHDRQGAQEEKRKEQQKPPEQPAGIWHAVKEDCTPPVIREERPAKTVEEKRANKFAIASAAILTLIVVAGWIMQAHEEPVLLPPMEMQEGYYLYSSRHNGTRLLARGEPVCVEGVITAVQMDVRKYANSDYRLILFVTSDNPNTTFNDWKVYVAAKPTNTYLPNLQAAQSYIGKQVAVYGTRGSLDVVRKEKGPSDYYYIIETIDQIIDQDSGADLMQPGGLLQKQQKEEDGFQAYTGVPAHAKGLHYSAQITAAEDANGYIALYTLSRVKGNGNYANASVCGRDACMIIEAQREAFGEEFLQIRQYHFTFLSQEGDVAYTAVFDTGSGETRVALQDSQGNLLPALTYQEYTSQ